ncbi:MAG: beta-lactamase family protein [Deltaproteobacteria bacterium]|nr:beta-lactamase family protein [Deltaproteobacteria bacterium]
MGRLLESGAAGGVYPGASACVMYRDADGQLVTVSAAGGVLCRGEAAVRETTTFDLASLTKPFVASVAARMVSRGQLDFGVRVDDVLSDARGTPLTGITLEDLLAHQSGLDAWGGLYLDVQHEPGSAAARRWIVSEAMRRDGDHNRGMVYSDLGYIVAGELLSKAAGKPLQDLVELDVLAPLGLAGRVFYAGALPTAARHQLAHDVPPTERCDWRGRVVRAEVHDENCAALGGIAGHAGLFGDAESVARLGLEWLDVLARRSAFVTPAVRDRVFAPRPGSHRIGWDTKSDTGSAAGQRMGPRTFGHLGFTGTSVWCDPSRDLVVVLLSNRVHPTRTNTKIRTFRPAFYDGVVHTFDG